MGKDSGTANTNIIWHADRLLALVEANRPFELDPESLESRGQRYRAGDKVMQTKNDYERDVYNGDIGRVLSVDPKQRSMHVRFDEREVEYRDSDLDALMLAV